MTMSATPKVDPAALVAHYVRGMNTPVRTIRVDDLWDKAREKAATEVPPRTMTDLVRDLLAEYVGREEEA